MTFLATNSSRIANIATQLAAVGCYTEREEHELMDEERNCMSRPAERFGMNAQHEPFADDYNVRRQQKMMERNRQAYRDEIRTVKLSEVDQSTITDATEMTLSKRDSTIVVWSETSSVDLNRPIAPKKPEIQISDRLDSIFEASTSSEPVSKETRKPTLKEVIKQRVAFKKKSNVVLQTESELKDAVERVSIRDNLRKKKETWEFQIDATSSMLADESLDTASWDGDVQNISYPEIVRPRPKAATVGTYFASPATLIPPLFATPPFPLPPMMEKMHWEVAVNRIESDLERYDGQLIPQYLEDIKQHMTQVIGAMDFKPDDPDGLDRLHPNIVENLYRKFPFMIHRLTDRPSRAMYSPRVKFTSYSDNKDEYVRARNPARTTTGMGVTRITSRMYVPDRPVQILTNEEIQARLTRARGVQAAESVQIQNRPESSSYTVIEQYNRTVRHFFQTGHQWPRPTADVMMVNKLPNIKTADHLQDWLLRNPFIPNQNQIGQKYVFIILTFRQVERMLKNHN